ncbi:uncharacterized protein LOC119189175 [Manduca sexta]|uniref:uncharacterized protein LOC119189175 n=1 Tax=Manduca sexta TaxID=7130 RepID=UPI00188EBB8C|nr:uncharacterized protein LOC119189175 [Manduca sexta]
MKSSGFLLALATITAVTSAQNQNYAQANAAAWLANAAANGAQVIHVHHKSGAGRPAQSKPAQDRPVQAAGTRAEAVAHSRYPESHPNTGQANAPAQAIAHALAKPHHQGHHGAPQPSTPASSAHQTPVAVTSAPATTVAKTPPQPPNDKDLQKLPQPSPLPDVSALGIPSLLPDLPQDIAKVIQAALTDNPLAKVASGLITAFITDQSTTVPAIIAGVHKGLTNAATVISPDNVSKAVAVLADKSHDVIKAFVAKLGDLIVSHVDKIGELIKKLSEIGKFSHAIAIGLSVLATLSLIFQNEVLPKIPADLSHLPIPLEDLPHLLEKGPIHLEKLPFLLDKLEPLKKLLENFGHGPASAPGADSEAKASSVPGQGAQDAAKADAAAKAPALTTGSSPPAPAAGAAPPPTAATEPEYLDEYYEEEEEGAAGAFATAESAAASTANASGAVATAIAG